MGEGVRRYAESMHVSRRIVALVFAFVAALLFACNASAPALAPEGAIAIPDVSPARSALADASARVVDDTPPSVSDASPDDAGASAKGPSYGDPEPSFGGGGPDLDSNSIALGGDGGDRLGLGPRDRSLRHRADGRSLQLAERGLDARRRSDDPMRRARVREARLSAARGRR